MDWILTGTTRPVRVDQGVMEIKRYSSFSKSSDLVPPYQMQFSVILRTPFLLGWLTPVQGYYTFPDLDQRHKFHSRLTCFVTIQVWKREHGWRRPNILNCIPNVKFGSVIENQSPCKIYTVMLFAFLPNRYQQNDHCVFKAQPIGRWYFCSSYSWSSILKICSTNVFSSLVN